MGETAQIYCPYRTTVGPNKTNIKGMSKWEYTINNASMRERYLRVEEPDERVMTGLTHDRIRHVARASGGGKGDDRNYQKQPEQSETTRSENSGRIALVGLAGAPAQVTGRGARTMTRDVTRWATDGAHLRLPPRIPVPYDTSED